VPKRGHECFLQRLRERPRHHHCDIDVASPVQVAAQRGGPGQVHADEFVTEQAADPLDQLVEVGA
jgi:hypothetical protein